MFRPEGIEDTGIPGRAAAMRNFSRIRDRLFYALFHKLSHTYAKVFPPAVRRCFEFIVFIKAVCAIMFLIYMHTVFSNSPLSCLEPVQNNWPRHDAILRIEVVSNLSFSPQLVNALSAEAHERDIQIGGLGRNTRGNGDWKLENADFEFGNVSECPNINFYRRKGYMKSMSQWFDVFIDNSGTREKVRAVEPELVFEYALEYGFLRLSNRVRNKLGIKTVTLRIDPEQDACFGSGLSRYIRREVLGVEDWLRNSFKLLAFEEDNKQGYLRNVKTDEHFKFISVHATRSSYIAAAFVMVLFTLSISMLLRYSHHQIFIFIIDVLQMLELNIGMVFPAAPLLTVILALVGIEAIMSEFFSDSTTAFYIIIIVWVADQYEAICCHTALTKRHWLRFFYLYHFAFYAYHYRFNGQYSALALVASWLLIQHSMLYFFHHYELPAVLNRTALLQAQNRRLQNQFHQQQRLSQPSGVQSSSRSPSNMQNTPATQTGGLRPNTNTFHPQIIPSLVDPTSLEYIEHLLEELIPARNGIVSNQNHPQEVPTNRSEPGVVSRTEPTAAMTASEGRNSLRDLGTREASRSDLRVSGQTFANNVALYPFQSLIVSLLIRLLNFIQTGSPRIPNIPNGQMASNQFNANNLSTLNNDNTSDDRAVHGQETAGSENGLSAGQGQIGASRFCGSERAAQHHRRTQSANNIRGINVADQAAGGINESNTTEGVAA